MSRLWFWKANEEVYPNTRGSAVLEQEILLHDKKITPPINWYLISVKFYINSLSIFTWSKKMYFDIVCPKIMAIFFYKFS